jgi:hypothetical protein
MGPDPQACWENFDVRRRPGMDVTSVLMDIATNPVTRSGKTREWQ